MAGPGPFAPAARAQTVNPKTAVTDFIKAGLIDPSSHEGVDWNQPVKLDPNGPYTQAIRHTYRLRDPMYGRVSFDDIFFLDSDGHVLEEPPLGGGPGEVVTG